MRKQKFFAMILCLLVLVMIPAAASAQDKAKKVIIYYDGEVVSSRDVLSVAVGSSITLTAEDPDGYESSFIWTSGNKNIATVEDGTVTGVKKGLATITAMSESKSAKYSVNVRVLNKAVESIEILPPSTFDPEEDHLVDKLSLQLKAIVSPADADLKGVTWKVTSADCSDPFDKEDDACLQKPPATISTSGKLTASGVSAQTEVKVWAIATDGSGVMGDLTITLFPRARRLLIFDNTDVEDYGIEIPGDYADEHHFYGCLDDSDEKCFYPNLTDKIAPIVKDLSTDDKTVTLVAMLDWGDYIEEVKYHADTESEFGGIVQWSSSNKKIAVVDQTGVVTFLKAGTVTITAKTTDGSNLVATVKITARVMVEKIVISGSEALEGGKSMKLKTTIYPSTASIKKMTCKSSDPGVATVSNGGMVKTSKVAIPRSVTITCYATDADPRNQEIAEASFDFTVYPAPERIKIYDELGLVITKTLALDLDELTTYQLTAEVEPYYYSAEELVWSSSNKKVATVDSVTGELTLLSTGTTKITAKSVDHSGLKKTITVVVRNLISSLTIEADFTPIRSGKTTVVRITDWDPVAPSKKAVKWRSTDPSVLTVKGSWPKATVTAKDVLETTCADVYAEADDGGVDEYGDPIRSNEETICVYPAVKALKIMKTMETPDPEDPASTVETERDITGRIYYLELYDTLEIGDDIYGMKIPEDALSGGEDVAWSTSNKKVLSFDGGSTFTGNSVGTAKITVKAMDGTGKKASITVKVVKPEKMPDPEYIVYSAPDTNAVVGDPVSPDESSMLIPQGPDAASVEELSGTVNAQIVEETMEETVTEAEGLRISGPEYAMPGESVQLSVSGETEGAEVYWFSSNEETASVDAAGNVKVSENADLDTVLTITALLNDGEGTYAMHDIVIGELKAALPEGEENTETAEPAEEDLPAAEVEVITAEAEDAAAEVEETPAEAEEVTSEAEETPAEGEEAAAEAEVTPAEVEEPAAETEEPAAETVETPSEAEEPAAEAEETPAEAEEPVTETAAPAVEKIEADIENDLVTMTVGEQFTLESDKLNILPAEADWNTLSFKVENEYLAALESDEAAKIREDGLKLTALAAGETKLTVKAGDIEKVIRIVVEALPVVEEPVQETVVEEVTAPVVESVPEPDPEPVYEEPAAEEPAPEPEPEPVAEEPAPEPAAEEPAPEPEPVQEEPQPAAEEAEAAEE